MTEPTWFDAWFESPWYSKLYKHRSQAEADKAAQMVASLPQVKAGSNVLDLCCGYGRHSVALGELGFDVRGLDGSSNLIERARTEFAHPNVQYVVGDMRGPFPDAIYNVVVNFFTSFGYFDADEENYRVIEAVFQHLSNGGVFVLDYFNSEVVLRDLVPESVSIIDGVTIIEQRSADEKYVRKKITVNNPCAFEQEFSEQVRLYSMADLVGMLTRAGFEVSQIFGDYDATLFLPYESKRCIVVATKPAK